jgi:2,4-dienoyl-CoA reductase-like NADH-dependent reductase (Old Yellow Enzyme family)
VGNVATSPATKSNAGTSVLADERDVPRFAVIARSIKARGSVPGLQLAESPNHLAPSVKWRTQDPPTEIARLRAIVSNLSTQDLDGAMRRFRTSARLAAVAGFEVIQMHAAHGYTLSLLLNPITNPREDRYRFDGTWLHELVEDVRADLPTSLISVRLNLFASDATAKADVALAAMQAEGLQGVGVDIIDFSAGLYTLDRFEIYPTLRDGPLPLFRPAADVVNRLQCLVILSGNVVDLRAVNVALPPRVLIGVGRAMIADADFALKTSNNRDNEIRRCQRCNHCHYFSRGRPFLECGVNKSL